MSHENVEIVRRGWEHFEATGELLQDILAPDFVWVMSTFRGVMDFEDEYRGTAGVERFLVPRDRLHAARRPGDARGSVRRPGGSPKSRGA